MEEMEEAKLLPCRHMFHTLCIQAWLNKVSLKNAFLTLLLFRTGPREKTNVTCSQRFSSRTGGGRGSKKNQLTQVHLEQEEGRGGTG